MTSEKKNPHNIAEFTAELAILIKENDFPWDLSILKAVRGYELARLHF